MPSDYIVFDFETTGLNRNSEDRATEIAAVRYINNKPTERFWSLCNPQKAIGPFCVALNGITDNMVKREPTFDQLLKEFLDFIGNDPIVAHNAPFDIMFLREACIRTGTPLPKNEVIDTLALARAKCNTTNHKLPTLVRELGLKNESCHRSMADVLATGELYQWLTTK